MIRILSLCLFLFLYLFSTNFSYSQSWRPVGMIVSSTDFIYNIASAPNGDIYSSVWANGVYRSTDLGTSWTLSGLSGKRVSYIKADPNGDIYALSKTTSISYIHRSTDNGQSWQDVYTRAFANNYAAGGGFVFPNDSTVVAAYAVTVGPTIGDVASFVFRSTDNGSNWVQTTVIAAGFVGGLEITRDGKILLGTSLAGVVYSVNNGSNFLNLTTFPPIYIETILINQFHTLYVADAFDLNRSTDNGSTFIDIGSQNSDQYMRTAGVNSNDDLFLSMDDYKIFHSTNSGDNWMQVNQGIPENTIIYTFTSSNGKMFAGTNNAGVFVFDNLTVVNSINENVNDFELFQNYPNPFNPVTNLEFRIFPKGLLRSELGFVSLKIYDVLGKESATLVNTKLNPGKYKYQFDASGLISGFYFYTLLFNGEIIDTKKMILLK